MQNLGGKQSVLWELENRELPVPGVRQDRTKSNFCTPVLATLHCSCPFVHFA